jgi:hypothetical protein
MKRKTIFISGLLLMVLSISGALVQAQNLPTPQVVFAGTEDYEANGQQWTRYKLALVNRSAYANELFTAAPDLPPCGLNKNSSRTWVDIFNRQGRKRIYGFCALSGPAELGHLWFAVEKGTPPPDSVYITITDRRANNRATSNVVAISSSASSASATEPTTNGDLPDLVIQRFQLLDPSTGDLSILVTNIGKGSAGASTLRLIVWQPGQFEQKEAKTIFVKVGALASHKWAVVRAKAGVPIINTKYSMYIDISEEVTESNENNNRREGEAGNFKP